MDYAFDSEASITSEKIEDEIGDEHLGTMRLGDFAWFCKFLNTISLRDEKRTKDD